MATDSIRISYFSDVLCVWAYLAQVRVDELRSNFPDQVAVDHHFVPVFGDVAGKLEPRWRDRDGLAGYSRHVKEVASRFEHVTVHPDIWARNAPRSSMSCHLFLCAVKLACGRDSGAFERAIWALRCAFFVDLADVGNLAVQLSLADRQGLPIAAIESEIASGAAHAALAHDLDLVREHAVTVSPTMIFNEGRQRLNGNVGYRVIEANIRELLRGNPEGLSWC